MNGWISLHRKMLDNPIICKDTEYMAVWIYLLLNATHKSYEVLFEGKRIILEPGQLITGRKSIASQLKVDEYKVQRILKTFENEQQIAQQTTPRNRLITILNWELYQNNAQQDAQQLHNRCTTDAQQLHTNNNINKVNNDNKEYIYSSVVEYLNSKTNKSYKSTTKKTKDLIKARQNEGFTLDDFKKVIDNKVKSWANTEWEKYLRPETLFGTKFESYLNEKEGNYGKPKGNNGTNSNTGGASEESLRLEQLAKEQGLINPDGSVEPVGEVDF